MPQSTRENDAGRSADARDLFSLRGKVAVVTGGYGLYGAALSEGLAEMGAHVIVASRDGEKCGEFASALAARGLSAEGETLDLGDDGSIGAFVARVTERHGGIDVLVNNAVTRAGFAELHDITREALSGTAAVNVNGQILLTKAVIPAMRARGGGSVVNISSIRGLDAPHVPFYEPDQKISVNYTTEKWALIGFTKWCAAMYGREGIRCNAICPGGYDPKLKESGHPFYETYRKHCPLGRWAEAHDIKGAAVFLASEASAYVTGATIVVDGGWTIW